MGTKRVEGKKKLKSIKSKVTSIDDDKKRVSRMGKKVRKGLIGPTADYMTRSYVLRKLQISLKDFRRLCILKGIYPRVPEKAPSQGSDKVYYDIKDIQYLFHEPLLDKFRQFKAFMKKIRREAGRYQYVEARRKNDLKPIMHLDHLVKDRYPRFIDALRDLDDCLSMVHLFSAMPSLGRATAERTKTCIELVQHWQYYIARTRSLNKVFISVKGVYFQVNILGETITWITPHPFTQTVPKDVDMSVMITFLEFYEVLLRFVMFKLYNMKGLQYPPKIDKDLNAAGCFLLSVKADSIDSNPAIENQNSNTTEVSHKHEQTKKPSKEVEAKLASLYEKIDELVANPLDEDDNAMGQQLTEPLTNSFHDLFGGDTNQDEEEDEVREKFSLPDDDSHTKLFSKFKFFISREVPLPILQLCIISFGGQIGWEGSASPYDASDPGITHHVFDRPLISGLIQSREYIQPQWIFDCINAQLVLPVTRYLPGAVLPPHLSPFVDDTKEGYVPKYRQELESLQSSNQVNANIQSHENTFTVPEKEKLDGESDNNNDEDEEDDEDEEKNVDNNDMDNEEESSDAVQRGSKGIVYKPKVAKQTEDEEAQDLSRIMMSKKTKRLYSRMQYGIEKKQDDAKRLEEKRITIEERKQMEESKKRKITASSESSEKSKKLKK